MQRPKLLFVDDEESIRQTLPVILTAEGFDVTTTATVAEAIAEINRQQFDILLSDLNIGQAGDGFIVVGAMRRIQPQARTYILTGYPDFTSALEAIRRQVDDYVVKPANVPELLATLRAESARKRTLTLPGKRAAVLIRENVDSMIEKWAQETERNVDLGKLQLSRSSRIDHLPELLEQLAKRLDNASDANDRQEMESALQHGKTRRRQAYSIPLIVEETRILYSVIASTLQRHLAEMDLSCVIPDLIQVSEHLNAMLVESLRSFLDVSEVAA